MSVITRVVLKSKLSGYYFNDFGVWTSSLVDAKYFSNEWVARAFVRSSHLEDVQLVETEIPMLELNLAA